MAIRNRGSWKILVEDRRANGGVREIVVKDERIASQRIPNRSVVGSTEGNTINTARLNLDSTGAYAVASHTAETSHVTFSLVSYTLRTDDRGNPTWIVTLEDRSRRPVGTIHIKAHDGRVSRVEGMYQGRNMEQFEEDGEQVDNRDRFGRGFGGQRRETENQAALPKDQGGREPDI